MCVDGEDGGRHGTFPVFLAKTSRAREHVAARPVESTSPATLTSSLLFLLASGAALPVRDNDDRPDRFRDSVPGATQMPISACNSSENSRHYRARLPFLPSSRLPSFFFTQHRHLFWEDRLNTRGDLSLRRGARLTAHF